MSGTDPETKCAVQATFITILTAHLISSIGVLIGCIGVTVFLISPEINVLWALILSLALMWVVGFLIGYGLNGLGD